MKYTAADWALFACVPLVLFVIFYIVPRYS